MRHGVLVSMLWMLVAATVAAQDHPDFSGRWVLESPSAAGPDEPRSLTVVQTIVRTNIYGDPLPPFVKEISVERQFVSGARTEIYQIGVEGGMVGGGAGVNVAQTRYSVRWEDTRLVMFSGSYSGPTSDADPSTEHTEVWELDAAGRLVVSMTDRGSGAAVTTRTLTYRK